MVIKHKSSKSLTLNLAITHSPQPIYPYPILTTYLPKIYLNISLPFYSHSSRWTHSKTFSLLPPSLSHVKTIITLLSCINRSGLKITVSVLCDVTQCAINCNCSSTHHRVSKYWYSPPKERKITCIQISLCSYLNCWLILLLNSEHFPEHSIFRHLFMFLNS